MWVWGIAGVVVFGGKGKARREYPTPEILGQNAIFHTF